MNPAVYEPELADVLSGLALRLLQARRPADGLPVAYEGVAILRRLAARQPEAHAHSLAEALGALSTMLLVARRLDEAVAVADECADVRRRMAEADPEIAPRFAFTLLNATGIRAEAGGARLDEAVALFSEATGVIERFGAVPARIRGLRYAVGSRLAEQLAAEGRADAADRLRRCLGDPLLWPASRRQAYTASSGRPPPVGLRRSASAGRPPGGRPPRPPAVGSHRSTSTGRPPPVASSGRRARGRDRRRPGRRGPPRPGPARRTGAGP